MKERIAAIVFEYGRFVRGLTTLEHETDLFDAGLTSHASAVIMTMIESELGITFPDHLLTRNVFRSVSTLAVAVDQLLASKPLDADGQ